MKWEYKVLHQAINVGLEQLLNSDATDGWEVFSVLYTPPRDGAQGDISVVMKRPKA